MMLGFFLTYNLTFISSQKNAIIFFVTLKNLQPKKNKNMRNVFAIAVGLVVAGLVIFLLYILGPQFFTFPKNANPMDPDSIKENMHLIPVGAMILVIVAHFFGIVGGMLASTAVSEESLLPAYIVSGIIIFGSIGSSFVMSHPTWSIIAGILSVIGAFFVGRMVAINRLNEE